MMSGSKPFHQKPSFLISDKSGLQSKAKTFVSPSANFNFCSQHFGTTLILHSNTVSSQV